MPQRPKDYTKGICGFWENLLGDQEAVCYSVTSWVLWRPILSRVFFITTYSVWNNAFMGVLNQTVKTVLIFRKPLKASLDHVWRLSIFQDIYQIRLTSITVSRLELSPILFTRKPLQAFLDHVLRLSVFHNVSEKNCSKYL